MPTAKHSPAPASYDPLAADYDRRWRRYIDATMQATVQWLDLQSDARVLDLACGTGELERAVLACWSDIQITGVDLSRQMLRQAQDKLAPDRVQFIQADTSRLPLADRSFDHVVTANSFHYFHSPRQCLDEMRRVLRPNGRLTLVDWCDDYLSCKLCGLWLRLTERAFHRTYSLCACVAMLEEAGFTVRCAERFRTLTIWGLMRLDCAAQIDN